MNRTKRIDPLSHPYADELRSHDQSKVKDIHHTAGSQAGLSLLYHEPEEQQNQRPETATKMRAKMLDASWTMFEDKEQKNEDWLTGSVKKANDRQNMFQTS